MSVPSPRPELKAELRSATTLCFGSTQDHCIWRGFMNNCAPTLNAAAGMSGNNKPFVIAGVFDMMGGNPGCHFQTGGAKPVPTLTCGRASVNDIHAIVYVRKGMEGSCK